MQGTTESNASTVPEIAGNLMWSQMPSVGSWLRPLPKAPLARGVAAPREDLEAAPREEMLVVYTEQKQHAEMRSSRSQFAAACNAQQARRALKRSMERNKQYKRRIASRWLPKLEAIVEFSAEVVGERQHSLDDKIVFEPGAGLAVPSNHENCVTAHQEHLQQHGPQRQRWLVTGHPRRRSLPECPVVGATPGATPRPQAQPVILPAATGVQCTPARLSAPFLVGSDMPVDGGQAALRAWLQEMGLMDRGEGLVDYLHFVMGQSQASEIQQSCYYLSAESIPMMTPPAQYGQAAMLPDARLNATIVPPAVAF